MVIEKVYGIQATSLSLSARFTMLAKRAPLQNRRSNRNQLANNRVLKARQQAYNRARLLRQQQFNSGRGLRRYGSENNVSNLRRSNSFGNLSQRSFNNHRSNNFGGNLSRSASFSNLSQFGRQMRMQRGARSGGRMIRGQSRGVVRGKMYRPVQRQTARRGRGGLNRGNRGRGRGRGMVNRTHLAKPLPSKEELDQQLDKYMSTTRTALDKDLDEYMTSAMELEEML